ETLGGIGYNSAVGAGGTLAGQLQTFADGMAVDPWNTLTKTAKDIASGTINLVRDFVALGASSHAMNYGMHPNPEVSPWLEPVARLSENFHKTQEELQNIGMDAQNIPFLNYNAREQRLADQVYNSSYLKDIEDWKERNKIPYATPEVRAWDNADYLEWVAANGAQSAFEFSAPMLLTGVAARMAGGAVLRKAGPAAGRAMQRTLLDKNKAGVKNMFEEIPTSVNAPKSVRDILQAPVARASAALQDVAKMQYQGETLGMTLGNVLATKYEADLEGYHAYKEYLDQARSQKAEELLQLGMGEDQIKETLDKFRFEQEKAEAQKIGEQVRNANIGILMLSNDMTYRMLGLAPRKLATKGFGAMTADQLENSAPITYALTRPWYSQAGTIVTDRLKEGFEELGQSSVAQYESDKGFERGGLMDSFLGMLKSSVTRMGDIEGQTDFVSGIVGAQVMANTVGGIQKTMKTYADAKQKDMYKKVFNKNINHMINTFTEPLTDAQGNYRDDALNA